MKLITTAVGGGILRDVFVKDNPLFFIIRNGRKELYNVITLFVG